MTHFLRKMSQRTRPPRLILALLICLLVPALAFADEAESEVVRVGFYESVFSYIDDSGSMTGYGYDYQQKIAEYTGWEYKYVRGTWSELMEKLANGQIDLLEDVSYLEEREDYMLFSSAPMGEERYYLYVPEDGGEVSSDDVMALKGKRIGVTKDSFEELLLKQWLKQQGVDATVVGLGGDVESGIQLANHQIDAVVTGDAFHSFAECTPLMEVGATDVYFAVSKERPELKAELDSAMTRIQTANPNYHNELYQKYQTTELNKRLSSEECAWLKEHGAIRVGYRDNYLAFCGTDENGNLDGALADILEAGSSKVTNASVSFEPVAYATTQEAIDALRAGEVDCIFPVNMTAAEAERSDFFCTSNLVSVGNYLVVKDSELLAKEEIVAAVNAGNPNYYSFLAANYPSWKTKEFESTEACLSAIASGEADCLVVAAYRANRMERLIEDYGLTTLPLSKNTSFSMAVNRSDRQLLSILNKTISLVPENTKVSSMAMHSQLNETVTFQEYVKDNSAAVLGIAALVVMVVLGLLIRSTVLRRKAEDAEKRLAEANADLVQANREQQAYKDELERSREAAETANAAKTSFLFSMSHDIRTPMNAIIGFRDLLEKHQDDPERRADYLRKIEESAGVLLSIINNVLEMARIEKGAVEIDEAPWFADQFCDALCSVFSDMMDQKGIGFSYQVDVRNHYVYCDPIKLREVFLNLLSNAYKYTEPGGTVYLHLEELESPREGYVLFRTTVSDTGMGMSEEFLPHLYEEFSRAASTTDSRIEGTGLGMPIVKRLVDLMGGTIEVESKLGEGTTFVVTMPHRIAERSAMTEHADVEVDPGLFQGKRILIAEDNDLNAEIASEILSDVGFVVERAEDGAVAVERLSASPAGYYDVVLMDVQMPVMNGYEATRAIRGLEDHGKASIPILAMTANAFEEDIREALRAGMDGHLAKPVDVSELMKKLSDVLR